MNIKELMEIHLPQPVKYYKLKKEYGGLSAGTSGHFFGYQKAVGDSGWRFNVLGSTVTVEMPDYNTLPADFMQKTFWEVVSSVNGITDKITNKRRDGNTIRIIDNVIQILFSGKMCQVHDHYRENRIGIQACNRQLAKLILDRLKREHNLLQPDDVTLNTSNGTMWLRLFSLLRAYNSVRLQLQTSLLAKIVKIFPVD
jgi:hypothetical protein